MQTTRTRIRLGWRGLPFWRKLLAIAGAIFLLYSCLVAWVVPGVVRQVLEDRLAAALCCEASVGAVRVDPYALSVEVRNTSIVSAGDTAPFLAIDRIHVDAGWSSLVRGALVVQSCTVVGPEVRISRGEDGRLNLPAPPADAPVDASSAAPDGNNGGPPRVVVHDAALLNGNVTYEDHSSGARHSLSRLFFALPHLSALRGDRNRPCQVQLAARLDGSSIFLSSQSRPFSPDRATTARLTCHGLDVTPYTTYLPQGANFRIPSAVLDLDVEATFSVAASGVPNLALDGGGRLRDIALIDHQGQAFALIPLAAVTFDGGDVLAGNIALEALAVHSPTVSLRREADGSLRLPGISAAPDAETPQQNPPAAAGQGFRLTVNSFALADGEVGFADRSLATPFDLTVRDINIEMAQFDLQGIHAKKTRVRARVAEGGTLLWEGEIRLDPLRVTGKATVAGLPVHRAMPYVEGVIAGTMSRGTLDLETQIVIERTGTTPLRHRYEDIELTLNNVALNAPGAAEPMLHVPWLQLRNGGVHVDESRIFADAIEAKRGRVSVVRTAQGTINVAEFANVGGTQEERTQPDAPEGQGPADEGGGWRVGLGVLELRNWSVRFRDAAVSPPVSLALSSLNLRLDDVNSDPDAVVRVAAAARVGEIGRVSLRGEALPSRPSLGLTVSLMDLDLGPCSSYVADSMGASGLAGMAAMEGDLLLDFSTPPAYGYEGTVALDDVRVKLHGDKDPFLQWERFELTGIAFEHSTATDFHADRARFVRPQVRVVRSAEGTLNVSTLGGERVPDTPDPPDRAQASQKVRTVLEEILIEKGQVRFDDQGMTPPARLALDRLNASVKGVRGTPGTVLTVEAEAQVGTQAPVAVSGTVQPFDEELSLELQAFVGKWNLAAVEPYVKRYVGYELQNGDLSLELHYKVDRNELVAQNRFVLHELNLGTTTNSPDASSLPIKTALPLLRDSKGDIDRTVSLTGALDDPEFRVMPLILREITLLLTSTVTAPFAMLAGLVPGGDEMQLDRVPLDPGQAEISAIAAARLRALARALEQRPAVTIVVHGGYHEATDAVALRTLALDRQLLARKLQGLAVDATDGSLSTEMVELDDVEYATHLRGLSRERLGEAALTEDGSERPILELRRELLAGIEIGTEQLAALAARRARAVRDFLVNEAGLAPDRVGVAEGVEAWQSSPPRVEFSL